MSIQGEIDRLSAAKASIAASLQSMGVTPPEGTTLEQYAAQLAAIASSAPWLPLSGGTMTGDLTVEGKLVFGGSNGPRVQVGPSNELQFNSASGGSVQFLNVQVGGTPTQNLDIVNKAYVDSKDPKTATVTLTTAGWTPTYNLSGTVYEQSVSCSIVKTDSPIVLIDAALSGTDLDADAEILNAWAGPSAQKTEQGDGTLTFYSVEVPTVNIPVDVGVIG